MHNVCLALIQKFNLAFGERERLCKVDDSYSVASERASSSTTCFAACDVHSGCYVTLRARSLSAILPVCDVCVIDVTHGKYIEHRVAS